MQPPNPRSTPPRNTDWTAPPRNRPPEHPILPPFPPPKTPIREALGARPARARPRRGLWRRGSVLLFFVFFVYHRAAHGTTPRNTPQVGGCTGDPARPPKLQKTPPKIQKSTKKDTKQYGKPNQNNINTEEKL